MWNEESGMRNEESGMRNVECGMGMWNGKRKGKKANIRKILKSKFKQKNERMNENTSLLSSEYI